VLSCAVMLRGRYFCTCPMLCTSSSTRSLPYQFLYRFYPSFNCPLFSHFPTRTVSRTDPSSLYPLFPLSLPLPYRKSRGGGRGIDLLANTRVPNWKSLCHTPMRVGAGLQQNRAAERSSRMKTVPLYEPISAISARDEIRGA
jgi:hypothetical protein